MNIHEFAEKYRIHLTRDASNDPIIAGKQFSKDMPTHRKISGRLETIVEYRSHIYEGFADGRFGLSLFLPTKARWTYARKKLLAAGFTIRQNGDQEGCAVLDPTNVQQARLALRLAGIKTRRVAKAPPAAAQLAARQQFTERARTGSGTTKNA